MLVQTLDVQLNGGLAQWHNILPVQPQLVPRNGTLPPLSSSQGIDRNVGKARIQECKTKLTYTVTSAAMQSTGTKSNL